MCSCPWFGVRLAPASALNRWNHPTIGFGSVVTQESRAFPIPVSCSGKGTIWRCFHFSVFGRTQNNGKHDGNTHDRYRMSSSKIDPWLIVVFSIETPLGCVSYSDYGQADSSVVVPEMKCCRTAFSFDGTEYPYSLHCMAKLHNQITRQQAVPLQLCHHIRRSVDVTPNHT